MEVIVQAELVHPRIDPCARAAGGDGDAQAERVGFLQEVRHSGKKVQMLAQLAFTYLPALQTLFRTEPVSLRVGLLVIGLGVVLLGVLEIEKWLLRRLRPRASG